MSQGPNGLYTLTQMLLINDTQFAAFMYARDVE